MNLKLQTEIGDLDLHKDSKIGITYQLQDIADISKRKVSSSQTFELYGTKNNNRIFGDIFDTSIDITNITFKANKKLNCILTNDGLTVLRGYLQLTNIKVVNDADIVYEVVLYEDLGNIYSDLGNKTLGDLNMSRYDHDYTIENIINSWDTSIAVNTNFGVQSFQLGEGYVYPEIYYGNHYDLDSAYLDRYRASYYIKTVFDKLFEEAGYVYKSDFLNSEEFRRLILPHTQKMEYDEESAKKYGVRAGVSINNHWAAPLPYSWIQTQMYNREADTEFVYNKVPFGNTTGDVPATDDETYYGTSNFNGHTYTCPKEGRYDINVNFNTFFQYWRADGGRFRYNDGYHKLTCRLVLKRNGVESNLDSSVYDFDVFPSDSNDHWGTWFDMSNNGGLTYFSLTADKVILYPGDQIYVSIRGEMYASGSSRMQWKSGISFVSDSVYARLGIVQNDGASDFGEFKVSLSETALGEGELITGKSFLPSKMKQKDFFMSIVRMFNLYIQNDPEVSNGFLIEPRDDFYEKGVVRGWDDIWSKKQELEIKPLGSVVSKRTIFKYKKGSDYYQKFVSDSLQEKYALNGIGYGSKVLEVDNDFLNKDTNISIGFELLQPLSLTGNRLLSSCIDKEFTDTESKEANSSPKIAVYNGLVDTNTYKIKKYEGDNSGDDLTSYPHISHSYLDEQWNISFKEFSYKDIYNYNNQGNLYYRYYLQEMTEKLDENNKIVIGYFYLTPLDIHNFNFNDKIFFRGNYYRVLKIHNYTSTSDAPTKVTLLKIRNAKVYFPTKLVAGDSVAASCPTDIKLSTGRYRVPGVYYSESGQEITEQCCNALGGEWNGSYCRVSFGYGDGLGGIGDLSPVIDGAGFGSDGSLGDTIFEPVPPTRDWGGFGRVPTTGISVGSSNDLHDSTNVFAVGDNIRVSDGATNVFAIGSDINVRTSDTTVINNLSLDNEKVRDLIADDTSYINVIDGGEDVVFEDVPNSPFDVIDGGEDTIITRSRETTYKLLDGNSFIYDKPVFLWKVTGENIYK